MASERLARQSMPSETATITALYLSEYLFHVLKVMFFRKVAFGKVDKVWCGFAVCTQYAGRSREPACVTSHYFYYRNGRNQGVYPAVTDDFLQCCSNVFCRRAETGSMGVSGKSLSIVFGTPTTFISMWFSLK